MSVLKQKINDTWVTVGNNLSSHNHDSRYLQDAPSDDKQYARENGEWVEVEGVSNFNDLTHRPTYNGATITSSTNIPEVKTATWDAKGTYSKPSGGIPKSDLATAVQGSLDKADSAIQASQKGVANGVAELDANGKVPSAQLPSYVDDVLEYGAKASFPATGETGKIYVDTATNLTYRWSGTAYVEISPSLALGETSATAYRGDRGKTAYDHSQVTTGNPHSVTKSDVGLGNVGNFKAVSTEANQGLTNAEKTNAGENIGLPFGIKSVTETPILTDVTVNMSPVYDGNNNLLYYKSDDLLSTAISGTDFGTYFKLIIDGVSNICSCELKMSQWQNATTKTEGDWHYSLCIGDVSVIGFQQVEEGYGYNNYVISKNYYLDNKINLFSNNSSSTHTISLVKLTYNLTKIPNQISTFDPQLIRRGDDDLGSSILLGYAKEATGTCSIAEGAMTSAKGNFSHAEGSLTTAEGGYSHAEGYGTTSGVGAHAEGTSTNASGQASHAEGYLSTSSGIGSHAEGYGTIAASMVQHAEGKHNVSDSSMTYLHISGNGADENNRSNAYALDWNGTGHYNGDVYINCNADSTGGTAIGTALGTKVDKVTGKGLSTEDYTSAEKTKLAGIASGATANTGTVTSVAVKMNGSTKGTVTTSGEIDLGTVLTAHQDISGKQDASTAVTHTASTAVGNATTPVYVASDGKATALSYTIAKSVPSDAVFTDTNTWRGIQDNLTSTSTTDSLSANQGKVLKDLVDGKADTSHTHDDRYCTKANTATKSTITTATLAAASWSGSSAPYTYTLSVSGVTATNTVEILPGTNITSAQLEALQSANIQDGGQSAGSITLKAFGEKPSVDAPIRIIVRGDL